MAYYDETGHLNVPIASCNCLNPATAFALRPAIRIFYFIGYLRSPV